MLAFDVERDVERADGRYLTQDTYTWYVSGAMGGVIHTLAASAPALKVTNLRFIAGVGPT